MPDETPIFSWTDFSKSASIAIAEKFQNDSELHAMVEASCPPPRVLDEYGRPMPGSATIEQHPEPDSYRWIIQQRRSSAQQEKDGAYIQYADQNLAFIKEAGPFSAIKPLFIAFFATRFGLYEFLYEPTSGECMAVPFGHLG